MSQYFTSKAFMIDKVLVVWLEGLLVILNLSNILWLLACWPGLNKINEKSLYFD
jgi:hypothetical protein